MVMVIQPIDQTVLCDQDFWNLIGTALTIVSEPPDLRNLVAEFAYRVNFV